MEIELDLFEIGLDYDNDRGIYYGDGRSNFGINDFRGGDGTGHEYLAHVLLPNRPDLYLIAHVDSTEIEQDIIASSKKNWFPAIVLHSIRKGTVDYEAFKEHLSDIRATISGLKIEGFSSLIEPLFELIDQEKDREAKAYVIAHYYEMVALLEPDSFIGEYARLKVEGNTDLNRWVEYVQRHEFTNRGMEEVRGNPKDTARHVQVPVELLYDFFTRNLGRDLGSIEQGELIRWAAPLCYPAYKDQDLPLVPVIKKLAEGDDAELYDLYFQAGQKFAQQGEWIKALNAYENAVADKNSCDTESFPEALFAIFDLVPHINDAEFTQFVEMFKEYSDGLE